MSGAKSCREFASARCVRTRVAAGKATACAEACPTGATKFGERDELIAEARQRIRENPEKYINHIYGLTEVGGTSVLLLSDVAFEQFRYRGELPGDPLPMLTYRVLSRIPDIIPLGGVLLGRGVVDHAPTRGGCCGRRSQEQRAKWHVEREVR